MNYELAKQLKDAGFPQVMHSNKLPQFYNEEGVLGYTTFNFNGNSLAEAIYIPTLSELIEECGDDLEFLENYMPEEGMAWRAMMSDEAFREYSKKYPCIKECCGYEIGKTPEEAVANLWLALNQ